jgi:type III secretion system FlhB-like substrate exporter
MAAILPTGATETYMGTDESTEILMGTESEISGVIETETAAETESAVTEITETETEDVAGLISGAGSRLEAIVAIAQTMGISLEDAEALLDKMIALGDEHLGDSDIWADIKADILENPEKWITAALIFLMVVVLLLFIIRGLIKNTSAQAATKANIVDIKQNQAEISEDVTKAKKKLSTIEGDHVEIKAEMEGLRALAEEMHEVVEAGKQGIEEIHKMAEAMTVAVEIIKTNSESAVKVNEEQALQVVQLLNIAMGRKLPSVSGATRKVWYEESVQNIKKAAGDVGTEGSDGEGK